MAGGARGAEGGPDTGRGQPGLGEGAALGSSRGLGGAGRGGEVSRRRDGPGEAGVRVGTGAVFHKRVSADLPPRFFQEAVAEFGEVLGLLAQGKRGLVFCTMGRAGRHW